MVKYTSVSLSGYLVGLLVFPNFNFVTLQTYRIKCGTCGTNKVKNLMKCNFISTFSKSIITGYKPRLRLN